MAINQEMPEDVLILILSRLHVKSLLRFKSVTKNWYSLIQNPSFISLYNNRSQKNDSLLVIRYLKPDSKFALSLVPNKTAIHDLELPFASPHVGRLYLVGSSNGVVCLGNSSPELMLWNPTMREFRVLPQPPLHTRRTSNLGFAFDPKTNDYKVLRVATLGYKHADDRVQIYYMSTDSWREIVATVPKDILHTHQPYSSTWLDGVFYWVAREPNSGGRHKIIAFHMFEEVFEQVLLPKDICFMFTFTLSVLRDSLALVVLDLEFDKGGIESCLGIWLRDGNGVKDPWNRKYSIRPMLRRHNKAIGFLRNGELLLMEGDDCQMVSYNIDTQIIKEYCEVYNDSGSAYKFWECQAISYIENLVSVKRRVCDLRQLALDIYSS